MLGITSFTKSFAQDQASTTLNPHQIRFSIGAAYEIESSFFADPYWGDTMNYYYPGDLKGLPTLNLSYHYQAKKWFSIGGIFTYRRTWQNSYNFYDDSKASLTEKTLSD